MFGRVKDAVADAAETLRRAYAGVAVVELTPEPFRIRHHASVALAAACHPGLEPPTASCQEPDLLREPVEAKVLPSFQAALHDESGWAHWGAEADVIRMAPLEAGKAAQVAVPPLPRQPRVQGRLEPLARPASRRFSEPILKPGLRRLEAGLGAVTAQPGLEVMLALGVPIQGENIQRLPKGLWMRYSLQLVRGTGENVRNLEVLGLFNIPRKGVADLRHDPRQGRLLLRLEASALRAARVPFILARRKDDGALLSCFVEDP